MLLPHQPNALTCQCPKHRFTLNDAPFMAIEGIWHEQSGNQPQAFAMLTTAPDSDVQAFHNRQIAPARSWIYLERPEIELLQPLPQVRCASRQCG